MHTNKFEELRQLAELFSTQFQLHFMSDTSQATIDITFNGQSMQVPVDCSISQLLELAQIRSKLVAVEVNMEIVPKSLHESHLVKSGDAIEAVTLVGGG